MSNSQSIMSFPREVRRLLIRHLRAATQVATRPQDVVLLARHGLLLASGAGEPAASEYRAAAQALRAPGPIRESCLALAAQLLEADR